MGLDLVALAKERRFTQDWESRRIGRHDVLVEEGKVGTFVYLFTDDRVLVAKANRGYREDVMEALLDAVADLVDGEFGDTVHARPIDVPGFALDRAVLLGPGQTGFWESRDPELRARGLQVVPAYRGEVADGEPAERFRRAVLGKGLSVREGHWDRDPVPRALVTRDNGPKHGITVPKARDVVISAETVLDNYAESIPPGIEILLRDVRDRELRLRRDWDRFNGTLVDGRSELEVSLPADRLWERLGPLFHGEDTGAATLVAGPEESAPMLMVRVHNRYRSDGPMSPVTLDDALIWVRSLEPVDGYFLTFAGRSDDAVQMMWMGGPEMKPPETFPEQRREWAAELRREGPRLWLEAPFPEKRELHGRFVTTEEAERMVTILAVEDRVAVHELGDLEINTW
ncbi:hypothetical protein [Actinomadura sp. 7K534]|uniref:hypothetical protein n=1 Tax=Actinomadura sp. 7K534 TaxID=2530366 RepID=UPI001053D099|nr:hypothetical protein [Actinomadura sp. 7K534]TDB85728.1 hypothetical protein E1266_35150 [Actinomadura sp. 7K534]